MHGRNEKCIESFDRKTEGLIPPEDLDVYGR
jgi:hypothetical protein